MQTRSHTKLAVAATQSSRLARLTGGLYLVIIVCGIFSEALVRMPLLDFADAAATAANITAHQPLFRAGFASDMVMLLSDVSVAVLLYRLFKHVNQAAALMAAAFRLVHAAVVSVSLLNYYGALMVLTETGLATISTVQRQSSALLLLDLHRHGYDLALVFFACSLFFLGRLVAGTDQLSRVLGYGLTAAGAVYLAGSAIRFLLPGWLQAYQPVYLIALVAELAFCLWLLMKGVKTEGLQPGRNAS